MQHEMQHEIYARPNVCTLNSDLSSLYALDVSKYVWTAGKAMLYKRSNIITLCLCLLSVNCEKDDNFLQIHTDCIPSVWTTIPVIVKQYSEYKHVIFYFQDGFLKPSETLENAYVIINVQWAI